MVTTRKAAPKRKASTKKKPATRKRAAAKPKPKRVSAPKRVSLPVYYVQAPPAPPVRSRKPTTFAQALMQGRQHLKHYVPVAPARPGHFMAPVFIGPTRRPVGFKSKNPAPFRRLAASKFGTYTSRAASVKRVSYGPVKTIRAYPSSAKKASFYGVDVPTRPLVSNVARQNSGEFIETRANPLGAFFGKGDGFYAPKRHTSKGQVKAWRSPQHKSEVPSYYFE